MSRYGLTTSDYEALQEAMPEDDAFGASMLAYMCGYLDAALTGKSDLCESEKITARWYFREYEKMPRLERLALHLCTGKTLDVGCGAGCHLRWLQQNDIEAYGIDKSWGAIEACKRQGIKNVEVADIFRYKGQRFNTIILPMNGIGIAGRLEKLKSFLARLKRLLKEGGEILVESCDIRPLCVEDDDSFKIDLSKEDYGEILYELHYGEVTAPPFHWLFIDHNTLKTHASWAGLHCALISENEYGGYLAQLTVAK